MRALLLLLTFSLPAAAGAEAPTLPDRDALRAEIHARDRAFFALQFEQCAPEQLRAMLTDDLEFYHDKAGVVRGADAFVAQYAQMCAERAKPGAWRSRRVLVEDSLHVDPVPGYGAIATGDHVFHERQGDGPEKLVGKAKFAIVWQRAGDGWRMARVLSYAHGPAGE